LEDQKRGAKLSRCTSPSSQTVTLRARARKRAARRGAARRGGAPDGAQREGRHHRQVRARLREGDARARPGGRVVVRLRPRRLGRGLGPLAGLTVGGLGSLSALALGDARRLQVL
jgi:hypothetical protein